MDYKSPFQPIDNELLVRNKYLYLYLWVTNKIAGILFKSKSTVNYDIGLSNPKILISNIAHLGDVVLSTCILKRIKDRFPESTIGFICGSGSKSILINHPLIDHVYCFDHWNHNRSNKSIIIKIKIYFFSFFKTLKTLKKERYDIAIDLYYFYGNSILLLTLANVPIRIGYTSGGFKSILTNPVKWEISENSVMYYHHNLVNKLIGHPQGNVSARPILKPINDSSEQKVKNILRGLNHEDYIIFHCGAGDKSKLWSNEKWQLLAAKINEAGFDIVFSGSGYSDKNNITEIINKPEYIDLCDLLSFDDLTCLVKNCKIVVCVDTLIVHIASAYDRACVVISNNKGLSKQFKPTSTKSANFHEVGNLYEITAESVYKKIMEIL